MRALTDVVLHAASCSVPCPGSVPCSKAALDRRLPAVAIDQPADLGLPAVGIDDRAGARLAAEHALALDHRDLAGLAFRVNRSPRNGEIDLHDLTDAEFSLITNRLLGYRDALPAADAQGLRVPEQLSVIGFDEAPPAALAEFTTVAKPLAAKGQLAGRLLLSQLQPQHEGPLNPPQRLATTLVVRATTSQPTCRP